MYDEELEMVAKKQAKAAAASLGIRVDHVHHLHSFVHFASSFSSVLNFLFKNKQKTLRYIC